jgi:hypothetical protein
MDVWKNDYGFDITGQSAGYLFPLDFEMILNIIERKK